MTDKSRTDRHRVFKLSSKVDHVTRHAQQLFKVKRSRSQGHVTYQQTKNAVTRQWMVISTSNLVGITVGVDACGILSRSVGQTNRK